MLISGGLLFISHPISIALTRPFTEIVLYQDTNSSTPIDGEKLRNGFSTWMKLHFCKVFVGIISFGFLVVSPFPHKLL